MLLLESSVNLFKSFIYFHALKPDPSNFNTFSTYISVAIGINLVFTFYGNINDIVKKKWDWEKQKATVERVKKLSNNPRDRFLANFYTMALDKYDQRQKDWEAVQDKVCQKYKSISFFITMISCILIYLGPILDPIYRFGILWLWIIIMPLSLYYLEGRLRILLACQKLHQDLKDINRLVAISI